MFLGRIEPERFPAVFGPDGDQPLDPDASRARLEEVAGALGQRLPLEEIAEGFLEIAVDNMAAAIRKISIARGHDVSRYALACFGGAGGQHACRVADALGMERILIHPLAGVLSAYGIGLADVKAIREQSWLKPLGEDFSGVAELERRAREALIDQGMSTPTGSSCIAGRGCGRREATPRSSSKLRLSMQCATRSATSTAAASVTWTKAPR